MIVVRNARIDKIDVNSFKDISISGIDAWFWVDTDTEVEFKGTHLERFLPSSIPLFATHIWGWGEERYVRIRVDQSLDYGFVGVNLTFPEYGSNCVVQQYDNLKPAWGLRGRIDSVIVLTARMLDDPTTSIDFIRLL